MKQKMVGPKRVNPDWLADWLSANCQLLRLLVGNAPSLITCGLGAKADGLPVRESSMTSARYASSEG